MFDWNVVVTVSQRGFREAFGLLQDYGPVKKTGFYNVLVMQVEDPLQLLEELDYLGAQYPDSVHCLSRVVPVTTSFAFQNPEAFEEQAKEQVTAWVPRLRGATFHVRMRRRGFKGRLSSQDEERFLDEYLIEEVAQAGGETRVNFDDPDFIIALETVGQRAGLSIWGREQLQRYPLLKLD